MQLRCEKRLEIVPGATHLFEEPGALEEVARLAGQWGGHQDLPPRRARPDTSEQVHFRSIPHRRTSIPQKRRAPMARGKFQYTDDTGKEQTLVDPPDDVCQSSSGQGMVVNGTDAAVNFYGLDGCEGRPMQGLPPGTDGPIGPFASFKFTRHG